VKDWAGFTAWEYGTSWASFAKAIRKRMSCTPSGDSWGCTVVATPCK
jgi:hypothetical protein